MTSQFYELLAVICWAISRVKKKNGYRAERGRGGAADHRSANAQRLTLNAQWQRSATAVDGHPPTREATARFVPRSGRRGRRTEDGRRRTEDVIDGRWSVVSGQWSMVDGRWSMVTFLVSPFSP